MFSTSTKKIRFLISRDRDLWPRIQQWRVIKVMGNGEQVEDDAAWGPPSVPSEALWASWDIQSCPAWNMTNFRAFQNAISCDTAGLWPSTLYCRFIGQKKRKKNLWCVQKSEQPQNVFEHFSCIKKTMNLITLGTLLKNTNKIQAYIYPQTWSWSVINAFVDKQKYFNEW